MHHLLGDIQGCDAALQSWIQRVGFSPSRDSLTVLGDLVNRGPDSLSVLRRLKAMGASASAVLGNHDLHLLAVAAGARQPGKGDTLDAVLAAPDRVDLLDWLRSQPLACEREGWLCVHAGVVPSWTAAQTLALADEVSTMLQGPSHQDFLLAMYGNEPLRWRDELTDVARWRAIVNVLTRIRFCRDDDTLDLHTKEGADAAPPGFAPWFDIPTRRTIDTPIAFGHWSTLGLISRPKLLALDTGCVWGGALTAVRVDGGRREVMQVPCVQSQRPGKATLQ
jgi:bis(5'-nucleosyl)-tetraphosphatase (symmetrical)